MTKSASFPIGTPKEFRKNMKNSKIISRSSAFSNTNSYRIVNVSCGQNQMTVDFPQKSDQNSREKNSRLHQNWIEDLYQRVFYVTMQLQGTLWETFATVTCFSNRNSKQILKEFRKNSKVICFFWQEFLNICNDILFDNKYHSVSNSKNQKFF